MLLAPQPAITTIWTSRLGGPSGLAFEGTTRLSAGFPKWLAAGFPKRLAAGLTAKFSTRLAARLSTGFTIVFTTGLAAAVPVIVAGLQGQTLLPPGCVAPGVLTGSTVAWLPVCRLRPIVEIRCFAKLRRFAKDYPGNNSEYLQSGQV